MGGLLVKRNSLLDGVLKVIFRSYIAAGDHIAPRCFIFIALGLAGFVTATQLRCDASQDGRRLGGHRRCVPLLHRLGSGEAQRAAGDQMALNIERVVGGGMHGEEALSRTC